MLLSLEFDKIIINILYQEGQNNFGRSIFFEYFTLIRIGAVNVSSQSIFCSKIY